MALRPARWPSIALARAALATSAVGWGATPVAGQLFDMPVFCGDLFLSLFVRGETDVFLMVNPPAALILGWIMMLLAMLPPLLREPIALLWQRSLSRRRVYGIASFLVGYGCTWLLAGAVFLAVAVACELLAISIGLPGFALGLLLAAIWQASPWRQVALNRCHHQPRLSAFGMRANIDALRYGLRYAGACIAACGTWMLLPMLAGDWHLPVMAAAMLLSIHEREQAPQPARWRLPRTVARFAMPLRRSTI